MDHQQQFREDALVAKQTTGRRGARGMAGPPGPTGSAGLAGRAGPAGKAGRMGATGATGSRGLKGTTTPIKGRKGLIIAVDRHIENIYSELTTQMTRLGRLQTQVDDLREKIRKIL